LNRVLYSFKSRRDDLFIANDDNLAFFLFFSGAGRAVPTIQERNPRAAEKQKERSVGAGRNYKQVILRDL